MGNKTKRGQLFEWFRTNNFDIIFLQEVHCSENSINTWKNEWGGHGFYSGNSKSKEGVAILINPKTNISVSNFTELQQGRLVKLDICLNDKDITLINIYGPNNDETNIFDILETHILDNDEKTYIIGGDFNTVLDGNLDKKNGKKDPHAKCREKIMSILTSCDLVDVWRIQHPNKKQFTWHSTQKPYVHSRLDYFLISDNLISSIKQSVIKPGYKTDHSIATIKYDSIKDKKGPGYFKLNNSLLLDDEYKALIKNCIINTVDDNTGANPNILWEVIKGSIRNETIWYSTFKRKNANKKEQEIKIKIETLENKLNDDTNNNEKITRTIVELKKQLSEIYDEKINGNILRSKAIHIEHNEKNTAYFAKLEKKRAEQKTLYKLNINNETVLGSKNVLNEELKFYKKLYEKDAQVDDNTKHIFLNDNIKQLKEDEKRICEGKLSIHECETALKDMKNNKSPGSDGFTVEFYKICWKDINKYLIDSYNYSFTTGHLTTLQKQGLITLIPKPNKDTMDLSNWRPITLLNIDYKIATKSIANRLKRIINHLIDTEQTGFIKGRYIGENVRLIIEVMEYLERKNKPGLLFFADFQKAFDSINHLFITDALTSQNFGPDLIQWISVLNNDIQSIIINNGHLSEAFNIQKGVRQGCPLSTFIFIICLQPLKQYIRQDNNIRGIKVNNTEIKQSLFADDATFFNNGEEKSFQTLIDTLDNFSKCSGLNLNVNKSIIMRIGTLKNSDTVFSKYTKFIWTSESATTLGIHFYNDKDKTININVDKKIKEFHQTLKQWEHRKLSLIGRITVIKTFALPKLIYPLTVLKSPNQNKINAIKQSIFKFIWNGKPDKIKRDVMYQSYEQGGLQLINIEIFIKSLKAGWVKRYLDNNNNSQWKIFFYNKLERFGNKLLFDCEIDNNIIEKIDKNKLFLFDVLHAWNNAISFYPHTKPLGKTIVWNNTKIFNKDTFFFEDWYNNGIQYFEHLFDYRTNEWYSFEQLTHLYNLKRTDFIQYLRIKQSLSSDIKDALKKKES